MPPALQPRMNSVLFDFVYRPDLANKKQNIRICYYGASIWQGHNILKKKITLCVIQQTHKHVRKRLEDRHQMLKVVWVVNL